MVAANPEPTNGNFNNDVMQMLRLILDKQVETIERIKRLEENMFTRAEFMAQHKDLLETRVIIKRVHEMVSKIARERGLESEDDNEDEVIN